MEGMTRKSKQRMRCIAKKILSSSLLLCATLAHAELVVDAKFNGSKNSKRMNWDEQMLLRPFDAKWDKAILQAIAEDNEGLAPSSKPAGIGQGHIDWNGKHYYAWAVEYQSAEQIRSNREEVRQKIERPAIASGGICALYVFDQDLNKLTSLKINLPENSHGTWCNGTYGLGGAGNAIDGVLVTISYYLTGRKPAQRAADIGKGWRYMTVLIRFEEKDGKLVLSQDDSCLGNPNGYDAIPDARKALTRCLLPKKR